MPSMTVGKGERSVPGCAPVTPVKDPFLSFVAESGT